jgi:hypothetical protein
MIHNSNGAKAQDRLDTVNNRPSRAAIKARRREIAERYNKLTPGQWLAMFRKRDLEVLFADRYGDTLPDDALGREAVFVVFSHIINIAKFPDPVLIAWAAKKAPWLAADELEAIIVKAFAKKQTWKALTLGKKLDLTDDEHTRLKITTFTNKTPAATKKRAMIKDREYQAQKRRRAGNATREDYLATHSLSRTEPWKAEGISKRPWERRRKKEREKAVTDLVTACDDVTELDVTQVRLDHTSSFGISTDLRQTSSSGPSIRDGFAALRPPQPLSPDERRVPARARSILQAAELN